MWGSEYSHPSCIFDSTAWFLVIWQWASLKRMFWVHLHLPFSQLSRAAAHSSYPHWHCCLFQWRWSWDQRINSVEYCWVYPKPCRCFCTGLRCFPASVLMQCRNTGLSPAASQPRLKSCALPLCLCPVPSSAARRPTCSSRHQRCHLCAHVFSRSTGQHCVKGLRYAAIMPGVSQWWCWNGRF